MDFLDNLKQQFQMDSNQVLFTAKLKSTQKHVRLQYKFMLRVLSFLRQLYLPTLTHSFTAYKFSFSPLSLNTLAFPLHTLQIQSLQLNFALSPCVPYFSFPPSVFKLLPPLRPTSPHLPSPSGPEAVGRGWGGGLRSIHS